MEERRSCNLASRSLCDDNFGDWFSASSVLISSVVGASATVGLLKIALEIVRNSDGDGTALFITLNVPC